jgi:diaminohydroxyphosphoribosylaminopyrimidine deaminase/5-amino-6-(5-phosphoribosylamino)uracil reductase
MNKNYDQKFIAYAINLAKKNLGITAPNPVVGCVIVKNNTIISSGVTAKNGRPHAEIEAINKVTDKKILAGAEIYISLEPCSHFGQTYPCVDEIIKYQFQKAVIAVQDPDLRVNGEGIKKLRQAGINVLCGILEQEAKEINRGFFKAKTTGLPFVTLKLATSLDGKIATKNFDSKWITSQKSRDFAHLLRAKNDAILIGANTVRKDNPSLDCRLLGLEEFSPQKVIISKSLEFDLNGKIFQKCEEIPTIILTNNGDKKFRNSAVKIIICAEKNGEVDLQDALKKLCQSGVNSILIEGGQKIATTFLQENLIDELILMRSTKIIGGDGISAVGSMNCFDVSQALSRFTRTEIREFEGDVVEILSRAIIL